MLYLANPNNPTGSWLELAEIERLLTYCPPRVLVVVDEAYQDYVLEPEPQSAVALLPRHRNLAVTRTFSKIHGLAALRVGCLLADPEVAAVLERCRETFNVNQPAQAAALAALGDEAHLARVRAANAAERSRLAAGLTALGLEPRPSRANFLLVRFGTRAAAVERALLERGIVVRPLAPYGLEEHLRLTVGLPAENDRLLGALREILG
ncbi:MAG: aminotransferase class I/II-fold pyridoxal phosphate-dependent enzyme [Xanthomonadales bacterium]|nr:aminotransferase class I/II-fold pyridoxal phosphate-dependent enzyme [Xanthomonadales bacterium]